MRVLIDASFPARGPSGTAVYVEGLTEGLRGLGVEVEHASPRRPHRYLNLAAEAWWTDGVLPRRARGFDLLHHPLPALSRGAPCPQVVTVQDVSYLRLPECFKPRFRVVAGVRHRAAARGARVVVVPSESTAADVRSRWGVVAVVAPYGPGQAPKGNRGEPRHFLYVGDDEPRKNLGRLLDAYARYRAAATDPLELVLAGGAAERAGGAGVRGVREPDLDDLHRHAAALVLPSLYEGFGFPALEAMHAGTPLIAARTAGLAEVCAGAARLVDPRDPDSIATALTEVATTPPLREELRRRGLERASAYSWEKCARAHLDAYTLALR